MEASTPVLALTGATVAAFFGAAWHRRRRRRRELAELGRSLEFNYHPHDVLNLPQRYHHLTLMREGHDRRAWDLLCGSTSVGALTCFAYRYEVGFGAGREIRCWLIVVLETDRDWGRIAARRRGSGDVDRIPWDAGGPVPRPVTDFHKRWALTCRSDLRAVRLPSGITEWLGRLDREVRLELCDHLVALQLPMNGCHEDRQWLISELQHTVKRLAGVARTTVDENEERASSSQAQPTSQHPLPISEAAVSTTPRKDAPVGESHARA
ncbi:MAG: hypothetical protein GY778_30195 [bacterium]|nr:hypothetical protein [bacterium]